MESNNNVTVTQSSVWINTLDPFLFRFPESWGFGTMGVRWYGLAYLTGFLTGGLIIHWFVRRGKSPLPADRVSDFVTAVAIGTMVGGRLGYCLFYQPSLFWTFRSSLPFWDVLAVHEGGMASHGGIAGIAVACILFARINKFNINHLFDLCTLGGTIGIFFGRIANFINGELVGRPAPDGTSWAVKFPQDILSWSRVTSGQGIPHLADLEKLAPAVQSLGIDPSKWGEWLKLMRYDFQAEQEVHRTLIRLVEAVQNHQVGVAEALSPALLARYPSQLIEASLEGLFLFLALMWIWRKPQKPGVVSAWFALIYSCVRIFGERYRLPDAHIGYQLLGLTRGQWLSFGLLAISVFFLIYWSRRDRAKLGGWMMPATAPIGLEVKSSKPAGKARPDKNSARSKRR